MMKTNSLKAAAALGLSALLAGSVIAQSKSKPVGYETIDLVEDFNYVGLRLHEIPVGSGATSSVSGQTIEVPDGIADSLLSSTKYLFEVTSGDAAGDVVVINSFNATADSLTLAEDISANLQVGDGFTIRPVSNIATVFGSNNTVGLVSQAGFGDSDQVWIPQADGSFNKYYYAAGGGLGAVEGWKDSSGGAVDPNTVEIVYTNGLLIYAQSSKSMVVSGAVKLTPTSLSLKSRFNYTSSIYPVGSNLVSFFGADAAEDGLLESQAGFGDSDQIWLPNNTGGFDKYYYGAGGGLGAVEGWKTSDGVAVENPSLVELPPGFIVVRAGTDSGRVVVANQPVFYNRL